MFSGDREKVRVHWKQMSKYATFQRNALKFSHGRVQKKKKEFKREVEINIKTKIFKTMVRNSCLSLKITFQGKFHKILQNIRGGVNCFALIT